jgi:S1-C subfamily serine protease
VPAVPAVEETRADQAPRVAPLPRPALPYLGRRHTVLAAAAAAAVIVFAGAAMYSHSRAIPLAKPLAEITVTASALPTELPLPPAPPEPGDPPAEAVASLGGGAETLSLLSTEEIVTRSMPAVVTVETPDGLGTGFFVATDTLITNAHVVTSNATVTLRRSGGYSRVARVEMVSHDIDLAVLKVDRADHDQIVLPLAQPSDVHVGAEVIAIGSPLGLESTVTRGIVSALREVEGVKLVQTDAAINPGNSGGPLLDRYGRVLGVNTLKRRGGEALGFAVSIHYARAMLGGALPSGPGGDRRREDGIREYTENLRVLAQRADAVEANWKMFRTQCYTEGTEPPLDREWFALSDGRRIPVRSSPSCRSWQDYFKASAIKTHDALRRYESGAREAGVDAERMRVIRRRYMLVWPGWE